jgi:hypothetical protein
MAFPKQELRNTEINFSVVTMEGVKHQQIVIPSHAILQPKLSLSPKREIRTGLDGTLVGTYGRIATISFQVDLDDATITQAVSDQPFTEQVQRYVAEEYTLIDWLEIQSKGKNESHSSI